MFEIKRKVSYFFTATLILFACNYSQLANAANSGETSGSNIIKNLTTYNPTVMNTLFTPPASNNNIQQMDTEFHLVNTTSNMTVQAYLPYVDCANGGNYVPNSLTSVAANWFTYFCNLPYHPQYYTSTNPVYYYDSASKLTYAQVKAGLVTWNNPTSPPTTPAGTEIITTAPIYRNGLPPVTFGVSGCDPNYLGTSSNTAVYGTFWNLVSLSVTPAGSSTAYSSGTQNNNAGGVTMIEGNGTSVNPNDSGAFCPVVATVTVPVAYPNEVFKFTVSYSSFGGAYYSPNETINNIMSNSYSFHWWGNWYIKNPPGVGLAGTQDVSWTKTTDSCSGSGTVTQSMIAGQQLLYTWCQQNLNNNSQFSGFAPGVNPLKLQSPPFVFGSTLPTP
jgi:hypothetical protein